MRGIILKGNGKMRIIMILRKIHFHTIVQISIMSSLFFHFVGHELKGFSHTIFGHFLLGFL